jgi:hypothetical protein
MMSPHLSDSRSLFLRRQETLFHSAKRWSYSDFAFASKYGQKAEALDSCFRRNDEKSDLQPS